jgi:hypothetical protein
LAPLIEAGALLASILLQPFSESPSDLIQAQPITVADATSKLGSMSAIAYLRGNARNRQERRNLRKDEHGLVPVPAENSQVGPRVNYALMSPQYWLELDAVSA